MYSHVSVQKYLTCATREMYKNMKPVQHVKYTNYETWAPREMYKL